MQTYKINLLKFNLNYNINQIKLIKINKYLKFKIIALINCQLILNKLLTHLKA